jgi:hypothetical protein
MRRTVAQSPANRNGGSALNLNEGVIAARLLLPDDEIGRDNARSGRQPAAD